MAVSSAMFLFEVVVENVQSFAESRLMVIRSEFADIFSLELKDPKQMHIVIPDPPPLPPEPPRKKGKKKKPKKKKKGKGKEPPPPPEPKIQSGQSVLFTSTAEFLIQTMKKFPMEISLWSKEDNLEIIGSNLIPWDPMFVKYLQYLANGQEPPPQIAVAPPETKPKKKKKGKRKKGKAPPPPAPIPPGNPSVTLNEEYNVFEEGTGKLMAKIGLQIKLSHLGSRVTTTFRTLSEDPDVKKVMYTGINSKTTSYMCNYKTTDEVFEENCNKIENKFIVEKPIVYADYKNASGANLTFFNEGDYCCMNKADKPPESIYKSPETLPDIDFICDYIRKIIVSCNDNMRMLTPRPTLKPRIKATDIDKLCYCKETNWPKSDIAERFKNEAQGDPCPVCIYAAKKDPKSRAATFDIANIRGPCGKPDCHIARDMRAYIDNLIEEDNQEIKLDDIIGPCGSKKCTLAEKIQEFLKREGAFSQGSTVEGLSTQCACIQQMQQALISKKSLCDSVCSKDCESTTTDSSVCSGPTCPFRERKSQVYIVNYFMVQYDNSDGVPLVDKNSKQSNKPSSVKPPPVEDSKCDPPACPDIGQLPPSPADSEVVINFEDIHDPCCVKSCDVAETIKEFISEGVMSKQSKKNIEEDPCYCDCTCSFKFSRKTTYCAVCGGYECLGNDMEKVPEYMKPHPCPLYHKIYDKNAIEVPNPWPEEEQHVQQKPPKKQTDNVSSKSIRTNVSKFGNAPSIDTGRNTFSTTKEEKKVKSKVTKQKKVGKFTANPKVEVKQLFPASAETENKPVENNPPPPWNKYPYPRVPKNKGWNWMMGNLGHVLGMKPRPQWRPGATHKLLVRKYRAAKEGADNIFKKKRALLNRKKKIEMKPTVIVTKKDGEYTVQFEDFKKYSKDRLLHQYPYDEKPPLIYTIGKTEEEKQKLKRQRERRERRETRRKCRLLQSTFRDRCQEICVKAYNQAIGILPLPNPNNPECPCQTAPLGEQSPVIDSCSCSEEGSISSSDTDNDEWVIEFTPPAARWNPKAKQPPGCHENECQYNYLDYKVKLLDRQGNQVPRFFKGPNGEQVCSDLGGFWSPGPKKHWLEISKDGYIGPDNRWVPMNFMGHDGMYYSAEEGFFTDSTGQTLHIGIDGYIDQDGKWAWYSKRRGAKTATSTMSTTLAGGKANAAPKGKDDKATKQVPAVGAKGKDVKATKPDPRTKHSDKKSALAYKGSDKINPTNKTVSFTSRKVKTTAVMNVATKNDRIYNQNKQTNHNLDNRPSTTIEQQKLARYREIMRELEMNDDIGEFKPLIKTNRATQNTPKFLARDKNRNTLPSYIVHHAPTTKILATCKSFHNESNESSSFNSPQHCKYF